MVTTSIAHKIPSPSIQTEFDIIGSHRPYRSSEIFVNTAKLVMVLSCNRFLVKSAEGGKKAKFTATTALAGCSTLSIMTPQHRGEKHYQAESLFLRPLRYAQVMTQGRWILVQAAQWL